MLINKYIRTEEGFVLFTDAYKHSDMGAGLKALSAGFVMAHEGKLVCTGDSTSLSLMSLPGDTELLNEWLGL